MLSEKELRHVSYVGFFALNLLIEIEVSPISLPPLSNDRKLCTIIIVLFTKSTSLLENSKYKSIKLKCFNRVNNILTLLKTWYYFTKMKKFKSQYWMQREECFWLAQTSGEILVLILIWNPSLGQSLSTTRMHSSRMRTARSLTVSNSIWRAGVCTTARMQIPLDTDPQMQTLLYEDASPPMQTLPPPVNRMTDRCKNITFANFVCGR